MYKSLIDYVKVKYAWFFLSHRYHAYTWNFCSYLKFLNNIFIHLLDRDNEKFRGEQTWRKRWRACSPTLPFMKPFLCIWGLGVEYGSLRIVMYVLNQVCHHLARCSCILRYKRQTMTNLDPGLSLTLLRCIVYARHFNRLWLSYLQSRCLVRND